MFDNSAVWLTVSDMIDRKVYVTFGSIKRSMTFRAREVTFFMLCTDQPLCEYLSSQRPQVLGDCESFGDRG